MKSWALLLILLTACQNSPSASEDGETITRLSHESHLILPQVTAQAPPEYPWRGSLCQTFPRITKDFFRCKGSELNPPHYEESADGQKVPVPDCGGRSEHGLSARGQEEFIYPILCDLLNWVQDQTGKKVVITCGHRCPKHNQYADPSTYNHTSKHLIGAEVDFYVEGMEEEASNIVDLLMAYYASKEGMSEFQRYTKPDTNVRTQPWYNKEVFIKLFEKDEGRDFDNRHPYPYVSVQVRWDRNTGERVIYTWARAHREYLRR